MSKKLIMLFSLSFVFLISGCEQKPLYPKKKKSTSSTSVKKQAPKTSSTSTKKTTTKTTSTKKKSDVGVADAADYVTGYTPLKVKALSKMRLNNSYNEHQKIVDKALEEK